MPGAVTRRAFVFFMAPNDPRMLSTISAILENPCHGGLVSDSLGISLSAGAPH